MGARSNRRSCSSGTVLPSHVMESTGVWWYSVNSIICCVGKYMDNCFPVSNSRVLSQLSLCLQIEVDLALHLLILHLEIVVLEVTSEQFLGDKGWSTVILQTKRSLWNKWGPKYLTAVQNDCLIELDHIHCVDVSMWSECCVWYGLHTCETNSKRICVCSLGAPCPKLYQMHTTSQKPF